MKIIQIAQELEQEQEQAFEETETTETKIVQTPDRIENLRNIANFMIENCPRDNQLTNKLYGYGNQLLIIADELEKKLELTNFRLEDKPEGWN